MSAFNSNSSGGGIDPAQLDALVNDTEAGNLYAGVVSAVHSRADALAAAVSNARADVLTEVPNLVNARSDALEALVSALVPVGTVRLMANATGTPPAGEEKLGGITVPTGQFAYARCVPFPLRVEANNPSATGTWAQVSLNTDYNLGVGANGKAYLLQGGLAASSKIFRAFNLGTMAWEALQGHPNAVAIGSMLVDTARDAIYTIAGGGTSISLTNHKYTVSTDTWTALPNRAISTSEPVAVVRSDGKLLVVGGSNAASHTAASMLNTSHLFDPVALAWSPVANAPFSGVAKPYAIAPFGSDKFLVYCRISDGTTITTGLYVLDALTNSWTAADALPAGYALGSSSSPFAPAGANKVLVVAGAAPAGLSRGLVYDISAAAGSRWQPYDVGDSASAAPAVPRIGSVGGSFDAYAVMWLYAAGSAYTLGAVHTGGASLTVSQTFYTRKTA